MKPALRVASTKEIKNDDPGHFTERAEACDGVLLEMGRHPAANCFLSRDDGFEVGVLNHHVIGHQCSTRGLRSWKCHRAVNLFGHPDQVPALRDSRSPVVSSGPDIGSTSPEFNADSRTGK